MRNIDIYPQDKIYSDLVGVWYPAASAGADDEPPVPPTPPTPEVDYFYVKNLDGEERHMEIDKYGSPSTGYNLEWSKDKETWTTCTYEYISQINAYIFEFSLQPNEKIYFRSTSGLSQDSSNYYNFSVSGEIGGDVRTLIDYTNMGNTLQSYCFYHLFEYCSGITSVNNLDFSHVTALNNSCFEGMFNYCEGITSAPALPATTLAESCYKQMFSGCISLTTAPALPATVLTANCYYEMFQNCTSLTTAPALPATTLASNCYSSMFNGCTSISGSVTLPATSTTDYCYHDMFLGTNVTSANIAATNLATGSFSQMFEFDQSLNNITVNVTEWNTNYTYEWVKYAGNGSGTFNNAGCATIPSGNDGIPSGWTEVKSNCPPKFTLNSVVLYGPDSGGPYSNVYDNVMNITFNETPPTDWEQTATYTCTNVCVADRTGVIKDTGEYTFTGFSAYNGINTNAPAYPYSTPLGPATITIYDGQGNVWGTATTNNVTVQNNQ